LRQIFETYVKYLYESCPNLISYRAPKRVARRNLIDDY